MQVATVFLVSMLAIVPLLASCSSKSFLPSAKEITVTQWSSYEEVKASFDRIIPNGTTVDDLKKLGFAPEVTPNIEVRNYLDIMQRFMPNQSITIKDLDEGLQQCLAEKDKCLAYEVELHRIVADRYGNVFLDLFGFRRKTKITGWEFRAIIVIKDDLVFYKLCSGKPQIDEIKDSKNPLGPLQNAEGIFWEVVP